MIGAIIIAGVCTVICFIAVEILFWREERKGKRKKEALERFCPDYFKREEKRSEERKKLNAKKLEQNEIKEEIDKLKKDWDYLPEQIQEERMPKIMDLKNKFWLLEKEIEPREKACTEEWKALKKIYDDFEKNYEKRA